VTTPFGVPTSTPGQSFPQDITAGGQLVIPQIYSPNFSTAASTGWAILQSGLAYFYDIVLSGGTIVGPDWILDDSGFFMYSGTPGSGNLILSLAPTAGSDGFGNSYPEGLGVSEGEIPGGLIDALSITATQIADATITSTQIASATITGSNIDSGTITGGNIASATIEGSNIASGTITAGNIESGTITGTQIASGTITGTNIDSGTITGSNIDNATITATQIASGTITGSNIASATIEAGNIADATITETQIANGAITTTQISSSAGITGTQIASGTVDGSNIAAGTVTASNIAAGTITASQIAANTIDAGNLAAGSVTAAAIASGTITATQIASGTITASQLAAGIVYAGIVNATTINAATFTGSTFMGTDFILNTNGAFFYSGTPAVGNLIVSISNVGGAADPPGNNILAGIVNYSNNGSVYIAEQIYGGSITWWSCATENGTWANIGSFGISPSGINIGSNGGFFGGLPIVQSNISTNAVGNTGTAGNITTAWSVPAGDGKVGTSYVIKTFATVVIGATTEQTLTFGVDINGTKTALATLGAAFNGSTLSAAYDVPLELAVNVDVIGTNTPEIVLSGPLGITSANRLATNSANMPGRSTTAAFNKANLNTIAIYAQWGGAGGTGQNVQTVYSKFYREGP